MEPAGKVSQSLVQRLPSWVGLCKLCNQGCKQLCSMMSMHSICPVEWRLGLFASKQCSTHLPRGSGCPTGNGLCKAVVQQRGNGSQSIHTGHLDFMGFLLTGIDLLLIPSRVGYVILKVLVPYLPRVPGQVHSVDECWWCLHCNAQTNDKRFPPQNSAGYRTPM